VSDPLALYTDEDVGRREGTRLAEQALATLSCTAGEADRPLVLVQPPRPARRPSPERLAELLDLVREHADRRVREAREDAGGSAGRARVVDLPGEDEPVRVAESRVEQARLDRFAGGPADG